MIDELERIVIAKSEDSIVIFEGTSDAYTEIWERDIDSVISRYCCDADERKRFIRQAQNGPIDKDPYYWQVFNPLDENEFDELMKKVRRYDK